MRRSKIEAGWQAEAEKTRQEALAKCLAAEPVPIEKHAAADDTEDASGGPSERSAAATSMAVDQQTTAAGIYLTTAAGSARAHKRRKGDKAGRGVKLAVVGVRKRRQVSKVRQRIEESFTAKGKKGRKHK